MCIIAYKPQGIHFPKTNILRECFDNNPDGAGFMYVKDGRVVIEKGFMKFSTFNKALTDAREKTGDNIPYVMHFRIGTQGGNTPDLTHPFPLSDRMDVLRKLNISTRIGVAHNGIISLTSCGYGYKKITYSDTMKYITEYMYLMVENTDYWKRGNTLKLLEKTCNSKLAIMGCDGHVELIGNGWIEHKGVQYSNSTFRPVIYVQKKELKDARWDKYWNAKYGLYEFNTMSCPYVTDNLAGYCPSCDQYYKCYSEKSTGYKTPSGAYGGFNSYYDYYKSKTSGATSTLAPLETAKSETKIPEVPKAESELDDDDDLDLPRAPVSKYHPYDYDFDEDEYKGYYDC